MMKAAAKIALESRVGDSIDSFTLKNLLSSALDLAKLEISKSLFNDAFKTVNTALEMLSPESLVIVVEAEKKIKSLMSILWQLKTVEYIFRHDDYGALKAVNKSLELDPKNFESSLMQVGVYGYIYIFMCMYMHVYFIAHIIESVYILMYMFTSVYMYLNFFYL